jgi:predicted Zn-dependent protease with MMP-like domain
MYKSAAGSYSRPMPVSPKDRALFDSLLEEIIDELPDEYREVLDEVPVIVDDEPSIELQKEMNAYEEGLESDICGVHSGPSVSADARGELPTNTPMIQLFRGPILRLADYKPKKVRKEIRITLLHELGHHFDFDDDDLDDRGYG